MGDPGSIPGSGRFPGEGIGHPLQYSWASLVAQLVKYLPAMWETWVWSLSWEDPLEKGTATQFWPGEFHGLYIAWGRKESDRTEWLSLSQSFSNTPCSWTQLILVPSILECAEKAMAPYSSTLAWKIPWTEEPGRLQSMGLLRVGHDWATSRSLFTFMHWRRKWQPTPVFLPGESQGQGSLVGCRLRDHTHDWSDLAS